MKKLTLILLATMCATIAFGQRTVKTTTDLTLFYKPTINSIQVAVSSGSIIEIGAKTGDFYEATLKHKLRYLPQSALRYCIHPDSIYVPDAQIDYVPNPRTRSIDQIEVITAGDELIDAGELLLSGSLVLFGGGALSFALITLTQNPTAGIICGIGSGIIGIGLQWAGYNKLQKAGRKFNIGATPSGIGMTFNLNR